MTPRRKQFLIFSAQWEKTIKVSKREENCQTEKISLKSHVVSLAKNKIKRMMKSTQDTRKKQDIYRLFIVIPHIRWCACPRTIFTKKLFLI